MPRRTVVVIAPIDPRDPLHEASPPGVRWTRTNLAEAIPDVPTPLSWSVWAPALHHASWFVFESLGAVSRREARARRAAGERTVGIFHGRVAGNIDLYSRFVGRIPGFDPDAFAEQFFGVDRPDTPTSRSRHRWAAIAVRAPASALVIGRRLGRLCAEADALWRARTASGSPPGIDELRDAAARFAALLAAHTMQGLLTQGAFDHLARLATRAGHPGLEAQLVSGYGDLAEQEVARDLWRAARGGLPLAEIRRRHGYHGPNAAELAVASWREDEAPLAAAVAALASADATLAPDAVTLRQATQRRAAEALLREACHTARVVEARVAPALVSRLVPQREAGKAAFLRLLDVVRAAARATGDGLAATGVLDRADDVFYLNAVELDRVPHDARDLVAFRRERHAAHAAVELPQSWRGDPSPSPRAQPALTDGGPITLTGLAVTPGRAEGRARVVTDPLACEPLGPEEILVCHTTDPSWVALFLTAGGLVIDIGGPLSHGAIVARELGIPCVINTRDGSRCIPDGSRIVLDGDRGTVTVRRPTA